MYPCPVGLAEHVIAALPRLQLVAGVLLQLLEDVVQELPLNCRWPRQAQDLHSRKRDFDIQLMSPRRFCRPECRVAAMIHSATKEHCRQ